MPKDPRRKPGMYVLLKPKPRTQFKEKSVSLLNVADKSSSIKTNFIIGFRDLVIIVDLNKSTFENGEIPQQLLT